MLGLKNIAEYLFIFPGWNNNNYQTCSSNPLPSLSLHRLHRPKLLSDIIMPANLILLASFRTNFFSVFLFLPTNSHDIEDHGSKVAALRAKQMLMTNS